MIPASSLFTEGQRIEIASIFGPGTWRAGSAHPDTYEMQRHFCVTFRGRIGPGGRPSRGGVSGAVLAPTDEARHHADALARAMLACAQHETGHGRIRVASLAGPGRLNIQSPWDAWYACDDGRAYFASVIPGSR